LIRYENQKSVMLKAILKDAEHVPRETSLILRFKNVYNARVIMRGLCPHVRL